MYRFSGSVQQVLDAKGRATIPSRYRESLGSHIVLMYGRGDCIKILPQSVFDKSLEYMASLDEQHDAEEYDRMRRLLFSAYDEQGVDRQGRVLIPVQMRERLSLDGEIVVTGAGDHLEIWKLDTFEAFMRGE